MVPNRTDAAVVRLVPSMTTPVPPATGPEVTGARPVTVGAGVDARGKATPTRAGMDW